MKRLAYPAAVLLCACAAQKRAERADLRFDLKDPCDAAQKYQQAIHSKSAEVTPATLKRRDEAATQCAARTRELASQSLEQKQVAQALESYDAFFFRTDDGEGVPLDAMQLLRRGYEDAQARFLSLPKDGDARIKLIHRLAPRLRSDVVKRWLEPSIQETAEYHAAIARRSESNQPARAVLHYRLANRLGNTPLVTRRLWSRATQKRIPSVEWKPFQHCWKEAKAVTENLGGGPETAVGTLDLRTCEAIDETIKEPIEVSNRPDAKYQTRAVSKEAFVSIKPNATVDFDPAVFSDCVGQDSDGTVSAVCGISPGFRYRRKDQPTMSFKDTGRHRIPWTDQVQVPIAQPGESLIEKRVDRLRLGFRLAGSVKLQIGEVTEHRTLQVALVEVGAPGELTPGEALRGEAIAKAGERLKEILSELGPSSLLPAARTAENEGKLDQAEQDYLAWSLTTSQLKPETVDFLMRRYGLDRDEVSALFRFQPQ